jgi:FkbM family methyltransferase
MKSAADRGYEVRGEITIRRLDAFVDSDVQMIKIDVEGFEEPVLTGAKALLSKHNAWFIAAEANIGIIQKEGQASLLK